MLKAWSSLTRRGVVKKIRQAIGWLVLVAPLVQSVDFKKPERNQVIVIVVQSKR